MISVRFAFLLLFFSNVLFGECVSKGETYDAIIVGGGISGLSAAHTLKKNGVEKIVILEAADRIGGRVWTEDPWGSKLEMGASWIHGIENSPTFEIVKNMNITIQPTIYSHSCLTCKMNSMALYDSNGKRLNKEDVTQLQDYVEQFLQYLHEINTQNKNNSLTFVEALDDFSKKNKLSEDFYNRLYFTLRLLNTYEFAIDLQNMAVSLEKLSMHSQVSGTDGIIPFGYNLVSSKLAKNIPLELNCKVDGISYDKPIVEISTNKGIFKTKNCIVTVPIGVLKEKTITFSPALPKEKLLAIDDLQVGLFNKVYLLFPCAFWDQEVEWIEPIPSSKSRDQIWDIMNFGKYFKQPILLVFTAGSFAKEVEKWSDEKTIDSVMSVLKKLYGENIPSPSSYRITRWGSNPFSLCSYSAPGLKPEVKAYENLAAPVNDCLYFAGEATSTTDPSTVLGAFSSGERAAKQVLKEMKIKPRPDE